MTRTERFLSRLRTGKTLLSDGATGTMLQHLDASQTTVPEALILQRPSEIRALHQAYVEAGSDLVLSCTFGGNRFRLAGHGLEDRVVEINRRAAELAREATQSSPPALGDGEVFVVGDMGPTGQLLKPFGNLTLEKAADAYAEQAGALAQGGADLLLIETMSDLGEARAAIEGARRATDLPIVCTFTFDTHGRTMMGVSPEMVANQIGPLVEGVGANCGNEPAEYVDLIRVMRQVLNAAGTEAFLWAKPNAGLPRLTEADVMYDATPEYMGQIALQLQEAGARIVGGCCGTTPEYIRSMAIALENGNTQLEAK
jgi:5-methyltetrahydrofolate--homocysteine methyltransferase